MAGHRSGVEPGLVERIAQSLMDAAAPPVDGWRYATPILAADLAEFLLRAAERNLTGLYHLSGAERTNPVSIGQRTGGDSRRVDVAESERPSHAAGR